MDLNKASIIGRLTRDPELRSTTTGKAVCSVSVATGRVWKDQSGQQQKESEFHNVVLWGRQAEVAGQYLKKASRVYIEGRLKTRDWVGTDGVKRYRTEIICENMIMLDSAPRTGGQSVGAPSYDSAPTYVQNDSQPQQVIEEEIKVEDIPF
jgi:single-strand DNA-binding protein